MCNITTQAVWWQEHGSRLIKYKITISFLNIGIVIEISDVYITIKKNKKISLQGFFTSQDLSQNSHPVGDH